MAIYTVGFDNRWQATFDNREEALEWAREIAATGRTVEVISRRFRFGFARFVAGFPESESAALEARWRRPPLFGDGGAFGGPAEGHSYGHVHGGHGGGGHGGGHGGHGGGGHG